ncbi:MAG: CDP-2,3-bis-(O-geranylgeranyl)-sn-glycerol synthase [Candidatus Micrarchaeia archaeon]
MPLAYYVYNIVAYPVIYILPAYVANGAPVIFGGGKPLDMGKKLGGLRLFGDNKTIRGTAAALLSGIAVGVIEFPFFKYMLAISILLSAGTVFGDLLGSFLKRRIGLKPGAPFPVMDQYGFFIFAMLFAAPLGNYPSLYGILLLVALTGILHVLTNKGAHKLHLKKVPW